MRHLVVPPFTEDMADLLVDLPSMADLPGLLVDLLADLMVDLLADFMVDIRLIPQGHDRIPYVSNLILTSFLRSRTRPTGLPSTNNYTLS